MSNPVVVTAVFIPSPGHHAAVLSAIESASPYVHAEPGCLLYALHDAADGTVVLVEKWESKELLDVHAEGQPVARLTKSLDGLLQAAPRVVTMVPRPVGDESKGRL